MGEEEIWTGDHRHEERLVTIVNYTSIKLGDKKRAGECCWFKVVVFKVSSLDLQHWHYLGICYKCKFLDPTQIY